MSRREDRSSDSKRHRSRFDQQPSPKRSRRNSKLETERPPLDSIDDSLIRSGEEKKHQNHIEDSLPLEKSTKPDFKAGAGDFRKESDKRLNGRNEEAKKVSDPAVVPRSQSYSQHDVRDNSGKGGRNFRRGEANDRGWGKDSREQHGERFSRTAAPDTRRKENKVKAQGEDYGVWRHDKFSELQSEPNSRVKKRPAFREQKITAEDVKDERTAADPQKLNNYIRPPTESENKNDREGRHYRSRDRRERPPTGERVEANRNGKFLSTDRYGDDNGRDRFSARQGNRLGGGRSEKWKHDLFDEANRSPPPKSEEDQIAKVEALLAS